jgi:hypothetical protein
MHVKGKVSSFGGPQDTTGVTSSEDLAWWETWDDVVEDRAEELFLPHQPPGTTGLARRLNAANTFYIACRWDYEQFSKSHLATSGDMAMVRATKTGRQYLARPCDWGPNEETTGGRVADISPALMTALGIETDDEVEVTYPGAETTPAPGPEPRPEVTVALTIPHNVDLKLLINDIRFMTGDEHA